MNSTPHDTAQQNTVELLVRLHAGDPSAQDRILSRVLPPLSRWTRGRLPRYARTMSDTQDLVQDVLVRVLPRLGTFQAEGPGALLAFLKKAVHNQVVDEIRKAQRRRTDNEVPDSYPDPSPTPLERTIRQQGLDRYHAALATLSDSDRALIVERMERQRSYAEVAAVLGRSNANAARVGVARALARLVKAVARDGVKRAER